MKREKEKFHVVFNISGWPFGTMFSGTREECEEYLSGLDIYNAGIYSIIPDWQYKRYTNKDH